MKEGFKVSSVKVLFSWFIKKSVFIWILKTSLIVKNSENVAKSDVSKNVCDGKHLYFFAIKKRYKVSSLKILILC